jgi:ribosome-associated heat shock protein Hsp15
MKAAPSAPSTPSMRLDRLLVYLRFARTRAAACAMIDSHAVRRNRKPVLRINESAFIGDVLTLALGRNVRVVELHSLPQRRGSPAEARGHYREIDITNIDTGNLDPIGQKALAPPGSGQE